MPASTPAIVALDRDGATLDCAAKTCSGDGLKTLHRWLGDGKAEVLLLHNGKGKPLVLVNWDTWNKVARTIVPPRPLDLSQSDQDDALWPSWFQQKRQR
jgi:hypothetical protein